jgi:hypothetical protein
MTSRRRQRRHRAQAFGRSPYQAGSPRASRYARPKPSGRKLGPNGKAARAAAHKGLGRAVAAADTASSIHAGILAVGAGIGAAKAGKAYLARRRARKGPRRDKKGRFR